jgi:hypothetical protein
MGNRAVKRNILVLSAILCIGFSSPSIAQEVYKCGSGRSVLYTEKPCAGRVVNTDPAAAPAKPSPKRSDLRRSEENRVMARSMRRRAGESAQQFEMRRRRARLLQEDRAECARLDTRIPVEEASLNNPDQEEVARAEAALGDSRKRFRELRC